jgi:tetratricopeptide (TPR) repeat protein
MANINRQYIRLGQRVLTAGLAMLFGGYCLWRVFFGEVVIMAEIALWLLFASAMLIIVAIIAAFPIAEVIGIWVSRFYMPAATGIPPLSYVLAERYELERQWEKSLSEYEKIIQYYPKELPAHLGRMRVILCGCNDTKLAENYFRKSLKQFKEQEYRDTLSKEWERLFTERQTREI